MNNMLKAITASLLMEQVLAPNFKFKTKRIDDEEYEAGRPSRSMVSRNPVPSG